MLKFCVVPLYFMHPACALRKTFIPLPVTADTGSPTQIRFMESSTLSAPFRLLLQGQFTHLPLPSHTCRWLSGCFRSATLPFHRISYEITYKFIIDQVSCQPLTRLFQPICYLACCQIQIRNGTISRKILFYRKNITTQQIHTKIIPGLVIRHFPQPRTVFPQT